MQDRVLLLCPGLFGSDGVATVSRQIARAILGSGADLQVVCLTGNTPSALPKWIEQARCQFAADDRRRFARLALRRALQPRVATHVITTHVHLAPAALPSIARGARSILFLHSWEVWGRLSALRTFTLRTADRLLTNSDYTTHRLLMAHPECADRVIRRCWLGASEDPSLVPVARRLLPERFVLIVGRLDANELHKGHDLLLELWERVHAASGIHLVVAGDGNDRERLVDKATTLGVASFVHFLGRVPDEQLAALYRDCEFFAMPGREEGFGLVYVEAMREGKACLAGPGAPEEIVLHEETGLVVDPSRRDAVLDAILRLAQDADLRARFGRASAARAQALFTEQAFQQRFLEAAGLGARP